MYGYIYLTTNLINNKKYVGKHKSEVFTESYKGSGTYLNNAIAKYGWDNFKVELIKECYSEEDLNNSEIEEIAKRDAVNSSDYYNLTLGGFGGFDFINQNRDKFYTGRNMHGINNPNYNHRGYKLSEETRNKMSLVRKGVSPSKESIIKRSESLKGHKTTEETKHKISESHKNKIWINKDNEKRKVSKDELDFYLSQGFVLGQGTRKGNIHNKGKVVVNDGTSIIYINKEELESYLLKGYVKGKLKSI